MTPEQESKLYELIEHVVETKSIVSGMRDSFALHEKNDAEVHAEHGASIGGLEKHQTRLYAIWAAAIVIVPAVSWFLVAVGKVGSP
jgi:hypothetical protein